MRDEAKADVRGSVIMGLPRTVGMSLGQLRYLDDAIYSGIN